MSTDQNNNDENGFTSSVSLLNSSCDSKLIEEEFQNRLVPLSTPLRNSDENPSILPSTSSSTNLLLRTSESKWSSGNSHRAPIYLIRCDHETCSDPVIVPNGRITALPVGSREAMLSWNLHQTPQNILIVKKWRDPTARDVSVNIGTWLLSMFSRVSVYVYEDPEESQDLEINAHSGWPDSFSRLNLMSPILCGGNSKTSNYTGTFSSPEQTNDRNHPMGPDDIDLVVCVGGDGTVLHLSSLFPSAHPPVIAVAFGSLGFLTTHSVPSAKRLLSRILGGNTQTSSSSSLPTTVDKPIVPISINPLLSLSPESSSSSFISLNISPSTRGSSTINKNIPASFESIPVSVSLRMRLTVEIRHGVSASERSERGTFLHPPDKCHIVLNELLLERGPSPFMASLNTYVDGAFLTTVNADGLIIATQSGSTAYSLSAGGPIVQPAAASIVFTPICPHTLSFRPLIFADSTELIIQIPSNARCSAWASFDGRHSTELKRGDCVVVRSSVWPVPILCRKSANVDWLLALSAKLLWNARSTQQKPLTYMSRSHTAMNNVSEISTSISRNPSGNKINELTLERGQSYTSDHTQSGNRNDWFDGNDSDESDDNTPANFFARRASVGQI